MQVETPGYRRDIGHGASEAAKTATRSFSGAADGCGRYLSVPLFGGTIPLRNKRGVPAQGITAPPSAGLSFCEIVRSCDRAIVKSTGGAVKGKAESAIMRASFKMRGHYEKNIK
jgi:hypothetical protein